MVLFLFDCVGLIFFRCWEGVIFGFRFEFLEEEEQAFVLIVEVLNLNFHLIDFGGFYIFLEG
jgi:hypothetical protein